MTWQKFYEQWNMYGEDNSVWDKYKMASTTTATKDESFSFSSLVDMAKKVDMDSVKKGVNSLQKVVELLQGFTAGKVGTTPTTGYEPRQLFKKFED